MLSIKLHDSLHILKIYISLNSYRCIFQKVIEKLQKLIKHTSYIKQDLSILKLATPPKFIQLFLCTMTKSKHSQLMFASTSLYMEAV